VDSAVCLARYARRWCVIDADAEGARTLAELERDEGVGGLAALRDENAAVVAEVDRLPVVLERLWLLATSTKIRCRAYCSKSGLTASAALQEVPHAIKMMVFDCRIVSTCDAIPSHIRREFGPASSARS
jgi:hypothetical protein